MNRQLKNLVISMALTAFAGLGLTALGQSPSCCPQPVCAQPVCAQPACPQPTCAPACPQPTCAPACAQPTCCSDPCLDKKDLAKRIEKNADKLRSHFKKSLKCIDDCEADGYKESVRNFERATDRLKHDFKDCCDLNGQVQEVLDLANCVSALMDPCRLDAKASAAWTALHSDLETLASAYCTTASFQEPISIQPTCPQPACCPAPAPAVQTCCPNQ
jgi:hypothetical protein